MPLAQLPCFSHPEIFPHNLGQEQSLGPWSLDIKSKSVESLLLLSLPTRKTDIRNQAELSGSDEPKDPTQYNYAEYNP